MKLNMVIEVELTKLNTLVKFLEKNKIEMKSTNFANSKKTKKYLTDPEKQAVVQRYKKGESATQLAAEYGVSQSTIWAYARGKK